MRHTSSIITKLVALLLCYSLLAYAEGNTFTRVRYNGGSFASKVDPKDWDNKLTVTSDAITLEFKDKQTLVIPKDRRDTIPAHLQERLWSYLGGIIGKLDCDLAAVGGTANHVHLLVRLGPMCRVAEIMQKTKANSSRWLGEQGVTFEWQKGYGAFSVSPSMVETVKAYIRSQAEHHRRRNFEEEFAALLRKSGIVFEEKEPLA